METVIVILSTLAVLSLILIAFVVLFRKYHRISHIAFFLSALSTAVVIGGDSLCVLRPESLVTWKRIVFIAEAVMVTSWLLFSMSFARVDYWGAVSKFSRALLLASPLFIYFFTAKPVEDFFYSPEFDIEKTLFLENTGYIFNLLLLFYSIVSIINLEATLRSSSGIGKWQIKYTIMGAGSIIAMNIFYYSYALLYRSLNMELLPVREGVILVSALLIGLSIFKHKALHVEIAISRKILFRSVSIFVVGFYLLGLGIVGEGMRYMGPQVGKNITTFLGFAGAILIMTALLSEQLRRKALVFISKNFYSSKYDYREQWLRFTQRISLKHTSEELLESIAGEFKEAIGSRGASVWLKEKDNGEYHCVTGPENDVIKEGPDKGLIEFLQSKKWILNVDDNKCKEIVEIHKSFLENTETSLIVPLFHIEDLIGFVILKEGLSGDEYNYEDYDLLKTLAKQATSAIMNSKLSVELTEAKEMEAVGRLSSFIIHDLKNAVSMLSLIAHNAEEHIDNPDFQRDAMRAVSNTSEKIKGIIERLKNLPAKTSLELEYSDLGACVRSAVSQLNMNGDPKLSFTEAGPVYTKIDREEIIKVIINLIMNAIDAAGTRGAIKINIGAGNSMAFIKVTDNGCGMSPDFIEKRLFKPFQTTKKKGLGIGLYQCKTIIDAHSGKLTVDSVEGRGTSFAVFLPLAAE
ncbi:MAG: PEP-CTERM system histidine kinase PrsK [Nitrospiraceae bacterium]|nr:MAG: PEP-CTERM system histidine kinase PrsK [Nitrospiraceae bacterium]